MIVKVLSCRTLGKWATHATWSWWFSTDWGLTGKLRWLLAIKVLTTSWVWSVESVLGVATHPLIERTRYIIGTCGRFTISRPRGSRLSASNFIIDWVLSKRAGQGISNEALSTLKNIVSACNGISKVLVISSDTLLVPLHGLIMNMEGLFDLCYRLAVLFGSLLQGNHVLFEFFDELRVILFVQLTLVIKLVILRGGKSLGHHRVILLLDELLQLGNGLSHWSFGIVPNTNSVIFETGWHSVLGWKLEHLSLPRS